MYLDPPGSFLGYSRLLCFLAEFPRCSSNMWLPGSALSKTSVWRDSPLVGLDLPAIEPLFVSISIASFLSIPTALGTRQRWAHRNFTLHVELLLSVSLF